MSTNLVGKFNDCDCPDSPSGEHRYEICYRVESTYGRMDEQFELKRCIYCGYIEGEDEDDDVDHSEEEDYDADNEDDPAHMPNDFDDELVDD